MVPGTPDGRAPLARRGFTARSINKRSWNTIPGFPMPTLFVTGGCGFIGSNFIRHLLQSDINFDALTYAGNLANLIDIANDSRYSFVKGDITDRAAVAAALPENVDALIHFAAESHVDRSILDSGPFVRTNVMGTQVLLDAARAKKVK